MLDAAQRFLVTKDPRFRPPPLGGPVLDGVFGVCFDTFTTGLLSMIVLRVAHPVENLWNMCLKLSAGAVPRTECALAETAFLSFLCRFASCVFNVIAQRLCVSAVSSCTRMIVNSVDVCCNGFGL